MYAFTKTCNVMFIYAFNKIYDVIFMYSFNRTCNANYPV